MRARAVREPVRERVEAAEAVARLSRQRERKVRTRASPNSFETEYTVHSSVLLQNGGYNS